VCRAVAKCRVNRILKRAARLDGTQVHTELHQRLGDWGLDASEHHPCAQQAHGLRCLQEGIGILLPFLTRLGRVRAWRGAFAVQGFPVAYFRAGVEFRQAGKA